MPAGQEEAPQFTRVEITLPTRRLRDIEYLQERFGWTLDRTIETLLGYGADVARDGLYRQETGARQARDATTRRKPRAGGKVSA